MENIYFPSLDTRQKIPDCGYENAVPDSASRASSCIKLPYYNCLEGTARRSSIKSNSPESIAHRKSLDSSSSRFNMRGEQRRSIQFKKKTQVATIIPQHRIASDEMGDRSLRGMMKHRRASTGTEAILWYQDDEIKAMRRERDIIIRKMRKNELSDEEKEELLGLEKYYDRADLHESKSAAWESVIDEQNMQKMTGRFDDIKISELYHQTTSGKAIVAFNIAKELEQNPAIKEYVDTPRTQKLTLLALEACSRRASC